MKKSAAYIALLLIVVVIAAVLSIRVFTKERTAPEPTETPQQQVVTLPPTEEPGKTVVTMPPETPTPTPKPTEKPVFETREPITTEPPKATEPPAPMDISGSFRSDTGTGLNLLVDWGARSTAGETVTLIVNFSAQSYSFYTSALYNSLELTVNGKTSSANSPNVSYDGGDLMTTPLATFTVEVPRGTTTLDAVWHYKGSYSGKDLTDIAASATIDLN